jgi:anti-sigma B factor antagonist
MKAAKEAKRIEVEASLRLSHSTLTLMGELDRDALRAVRDRMVRLLDQGCIWLVIDFTDVSHLDYRGVPWLVSQAEEFRRRGGDVKVAGLSRYLQAIFRAAGAHDAFEVYEDASEARAALSQGGFAWLH